MGTSKLIDSSAALRFEVPGPDLPRVSQGLQIGGTNRSMTPSLRSGKEFARRRSISPRAWYVLSCALVFLAWLDESEMFGMRPTRRAVPLALSVLLSGSLLAGCGQKDTAALVNFPGDAQRGKMLIEQYGCGGCHDIPEAANANGNVGPPLSRVGSRGFIAGFINNSPDNMAQWIEDPQKALPGNAMPSMGISRKDARDITAFLYTLR